MIVCGEYYSVNLFLQKFLVVEAFELPFSNYLLNYFLECEMFSILGCSDAIKACNRLHLSQQRIVPRQGPQRQFNTKMICDYVHSPRSLTVVYRNLPRLNFSEDLLSTVIEASYGEVDYVRSAEYEGTMVAWVTFSDIQ